MQTDLIWHSEGRSRATRIPRGHEWLRTQKKEKNNKVIAINYPAEHD